MLVRETFIRSRMVRLESKWGTALFFRIAGFALQQIVPGAVSIGPVIQSLLDRAG